MGLSVGIIGLPNIGKSTTFNALTKTQNALSMNYAFCTIEPNKAVVPVPDSRLSLLSNIVKPQKIQPSFIEFVDIAGLVKGASRGAGLGNQFLSNIREVEVILHMVRCFEDKNIAHIEGEINPLRDIEIIQTELIYADITQLENKITKLTKQSKADKNAKVMLDISKDVLEHLEELKPVSSYTNKGNDSFITLNKELRFLSNKIVIYTANVDEESLNKENVFVQQVKQYASKSNFEVVVLCAKIEEEFIGLNDDEIKEFLNDFGIKNSGLETIIQKSFNLLGLQSYFTAGVQEVRAWTIKKGDTAPKAAGVIHNDFEKGFIKAEVISYDDFIYYQGEQKAKEAGKMKLEGKDYIVKDGDVMHFKFNI